MLEAYNRVVKAKLAETQQEVDAVKRAKQHPVFIAKKETLLKTRREKYQKKRKELDALLASGDFGPAKTLYRVVTEEEFADVQPVYKPKHSPRQTLRQKLQKGVAEKGGPVHPNILPQNMVNPSTKQVKPEFRTIARFPSEGNLAKE